MPSVLGDPPALRLHDTATGSLVSTEPEHIARLYVCGITPYDATHLGHAATYLAFDLLYRQWIDRGITVNYVQNLTDVDDPLLERAALTGEPWESLAQRELEAFRVDMAQLRILPPTSLVGVVEAMETVAAFAQKLQPALYRVDADLYFDTSADTAFGHITGLSETEQEALFAERGGDPNRPDKRHKLDCLVWRTEQPNEPVWDTAIGRGRPGWHVECAAIALAHLGTNFDVQGGGSDLAFPHHEFCASHVRVATGQEHAKTYLHTGMVAWQGHKMSKSQGNLVFVADIADKAALRLALLAHHYRTDWEWTEHDLRFAEARLTRWRQALARRTTPPAAPLIARLREELAHDLNAPAALAAVDDWCATSGPDPDAPAVAEAIDALLGVAVLTTGVGSATP